MKNLFKTNLVLLLAAAALVLAQPFLAGCEKESKSGQEKKPVSTAQVKAKFINTRCPIMGTPIDPNNVPDNLTRVFKGQKVAFCCGGCPSQWDKLSDKEKEAKLRDAASKK